MAIKLVRLLLALLCFVAIGRICKTQTKGFTLSKATSQHIYPFHDTAQSLPKELNQSFSFLGSGVQCFALLGEDGHTVLKLFKHHHMGPSTSVIKNLIPKKFAQPLILRREKRMHRLFQSAQIAYDALKEETGVFYTHLSKTNEELGRIFVYDNLNIRHTLDLNNAEFILQKKVVTAANYLNKLFSENRISEAICAMKSLLNLIEQRSKKGIKNKDGRILQNCGFEDGKPIEIDIGSYVYRSRSTHPNPHRKAKQKGAKQLLRWIEKKHPKHLNACKEGLQDECEQTLLQAIHT